MGNRMRNQVSPAHRVRAARLVLGVLLFLAARKVTAEPYLMVREGAKCSACHVNQSGGGKRTAFAHIHAKDILHDLDLLPIPAGVKAFNGDLSQYVSIGADFRVSGAHDNGENAVIVRSGDIRVARFVTGIAPRRRHRSGRRRRCS